MIKEFGPYISGKKFTDKVYDGYRMTEEDAVICKEIAISFPHCIMSLAVAKTPGLFYHMEPDIARLVPDKKKDEYFYTMKSGKCSPTVPSLLIYYIDMAIEEYGSPNYFLYLMSQTQLNRVFSKKFMGDNLTVREYISLACKYKGYKPFDDGNYKSKTSDKYTDLYIEEEDAIAMVPDDLAESLTFEDIRKIKLKKGKLCIEDVPISTLLNYVGAVNSAYDLRSLI